MRRRTLLGALLGACLLSPSAGAEEGSVLEVEGVVTAKNFPGLSAFLNNSLDGIVRLSLRFDPVKGTKPGSLVAALEDGLLIAYLVGGDTQISAREGITLHKGSHILSGFFSVKYAGLNQGISALYLEKVDDASNAGKAVKTIDIDRLDPAIRKQD